MKLSEISLSFGKEMMEVWRDRRTLLITLALPALVFPLFEVFFAWTVSSVAEQARTRITRVCFVGPPENCAFAGGPGVKEDPLVDLKKQFRLSGRLKLLAPPKNLSAENLVLSGFCDVAVGVAPTFCSDLAACRTTRINLYDSACADYMTDEENVREAIRKFADGQRSYRLQPFKIPADRTRTIEVSIKTVESERSRSADWSALLYTVMLMFAMGLSSMYPALDAITGERERGTLTLLLMAPGDRKSYVLGKLLTVTFVALVSAVLTLVSATLSIELFVSTTHDLAGSFRLCLPVENLLLAGVFLLPLALAISASSLLISSYARTFQQGQSYFAPLVLFGLLLCGIVLSCEESAPFFLNLVPVANLMLCMYRAIQGRWDIAAITASLLSSVIYLALLIQIAVSILDREESLFGIKQPPGRRTSLAREAFVLFAGCLAGFFYLMPLLQATIPIWGLLVSQILSIGLPALLVPRLLRAPLKQTLRLVAPSLWSLAGAVLLVPGLALLSNFIAQWQSAIIPGADSYIKALQDYLIPKGSYAWTAYLTIALGPAVCEELLFRGAIQGMLRKTFSAAMTSSLVAVMFGIMHGSSYRFLPTTIMGFIFCLLTEYTGSLFPAILLHAGNNALACYESNKPLDTSWELVCISLALSLVGIIALRRGKKALSNGGRCSAS